MRENLELISEIRRLRTRIESLRETQKDKKTRAKMLKNAQAAERGGTASTLTSDGAAPEHHEDERAHWRN